MSVKMTSHYDEIMKTKRYLPFKMGYLTEEMVAKAEKELGETKEVKAKCIRELRKMIEEETKLFSPTDDAYLLQYLRARKYDIKRAFSVLLNYYKIKKSFSCIYDHADEDDLRKVFSSKIMMPLPYRDEEGCMVYVIKLANWDTDVIHMPMAAQALTVGTLYCLEDPATQVCGFRYLVDVKGASLKHLRKLTPTYIRLFSKALKDTLPARFKGIHICNESFIVQLGWPIFKLFMSEKFVKRVHFHGDEQKNLHKSIPKAILTTEYGGDNHNIVDWFNSEIEEYFRKLPELVKYGYRD